MFNLFLICSRGYYLLEHILYHIIIITLSDKNYHGVDILFVA